MYPLYPILVLSSPSPETVTFPPYMHQFQGTWCLQCGSEGWLYANTEVVNEKFLMKAALDALKVSGSVLCGLLCSYMHVHVQIPWGGSNKTRLCTQLGSHSNKITEWAEVAGAGVQVTIKFSIA